MKQTRQKKILFACLSQPFLQLQRGKNNHSFATSNQLGNSKKSDPLLQQNFRRLLKAILNGITIRNFSAFVFAMIKVEHTVSDLITNYLFLKLKRKQNTTNFHVAKTLKFTS